MPESVSSNNMRPSSKIFIGLLLLLLLLFATVLKMPAQYALALASSKTGAFSFNSAHGSVWQGQVHGLLVNTGRQSLPVGKVQWQLSPWALLGLSVNVSFKSEHPLWQSQGKFSVSANKKLEGADLQVKLPLALLTNIYPVPAKINGMADVNIQTLAIDGNALKVTGLTGQVLLQDIDLTVQSQAALGSYGVRLKLDGDAVVADISDVDAPIAVTGQARFNQTQQRYQTTVTVTPQATASQVITQSLQFIAKKQSDGSYLLSYQGKL